MKLHDQFASFTQISTSEWLLTVASINELQMNASIDLVFCCFFFFFLSLFSIDFRKIKTSRRESDYVRKSILFF